MRRLFSLMLKTQIFMLILLVVMSFLTVTVSFAQSDIQVFTYAKKTPIVWVSTDSSYALIREESTWKYIRFNQPTIPVWLSSEYTQVDAENNTATVVTNKLNARLNPSLSSSNLGQIDIGYRANIIEIKNDFIQVLAPSDFIYAIDTEQEAIAIAYRKAAATRGSSQDVGSSNNDSGWVFLEKDVRLQEEPEILASSSTHQIDQIRSLEVIDTEVFPQKITVNDGGVIGDFEQVPERSKKSMPVNVQYRLSIGDSISVKVFGESDLSLPVTRIPQSGVVSFPLIGAVEVVDKTTQEIEASLISALSQGYVKNPTLSVVIAAYRPIFIRGAVASTGSFTYTEGLTLAQALLLAGGTKNTAKPFGVGIDRNGRPFQKNLSLDSNVAVAPGDVLTVDEEVGFSEAGQLLYVYLHGEVSKPGEYQYRPGLTVEKAVVLAGGFGLRASKRKVTVSRYIEGQEAPQIIKKVPLYLQVEPGDIISVGASWF